MHQPRVFLSRKTGVYVGRLFLIRVLATMFGLALVFQALDLLDERSNILAVAGNGNGEVWRYAWLRLPQIIESLLPLSVLLAAILTLAALNRKNDIAATRLPDMSTYQVLAPLLLSASLVAAISFAFNEHVVTRSTAALSTWQRVEYAKAAKQSGVRTNIWLPSGNDLVNVRMVETVGPTTFLRDITVYERTQGMLSSILKADSARRTPVGWKMTNARRFTLLSGMVQPLGTVTALKSLEPSQFAQTEDSPSSRPSNFANTDRDATFRTTHILEERSELRALRTIVEVIFPLLGAFTGFAFGRPNPLVRMIIGTTWGFAYLVAGNLALSSGFLGIFSSLFAIFILIIFSELLGNFVRFHARTTQKGVISPQLTNIGLRDD